jgi:hypothetical protein
MGDLGEIMIKALGAAGGSFLALVFQPPSTTREFLIRAAFSFMSGLLFGDPVRDQYLHWPDNWRMWLAATALVALISWWVFGAAVRIVSKWSPKS